MTTRVAAATCEPEVGLCPWCWPWSSPPLHICLQPAPVQPVLANVHTAGSSHHHCLLQSQDTGLEVSLKTPAALAAIMSCLLLLPIIIQLFMSWTPAYLRWLDAMPPNSESLHALTLGPCTTRPRVTACSSMPLPMGEGLSLPKPVH